MHPLLVLRPSRPPLYPGGGVAPPPPLLLRRPLRRPLPLPGLAQRPREALPLVRRPPPLDDQDSSSDEEERGGEPLDQLWPVAAAWRSPSKVLTMRVDQIECGLRLMVPALAARGRQAQEKLIRDVGA
ncbi:hypothetical protein OROMI_018959 [Orobanche minor]